MAPAHHVTNWVLWLTLASIPFFVFAWRSAWRGKHQLALWLLIGGGLLLRVGPLLDPFLHTWDERYHALVAKNMMVHPFTPMLHVDDQLIYRSCRIYDVLNRPVSSCDVPGGIYIQNQAFPGQTHTSPSL